jgi:hypothetical protein
MERIVPGADDADDADRLMQDGGARRPKLDADRHPLRPHPAAQMATRVADADSTGKISASSVSYRERWPKSAEITSVMRSLS